MTNDVTAQELDRLIQENPLSLGDDALVMRINGELTLAPVGVTWDNGIEVVYVGRLGALDHEFFESPTPRERIVQAIRDGAYR